MITSTDRRKRDKLLLAIKEAIVNTGWSDSDWIDLGYQTGTRDYIDDHPRLLRSLSFGDDDYPRCVLDALEVILRSDSTNLDVLLSDESIKGYLIRTNPDLYNEFASEPITTAVQRPAPQITSETVERAINDTEALIRSSGATSSVDRLHTTLHGFLLAVCEDAGLEHRDEHSITQLYSLLRREHPAFNNLGPREGDINKVLRSMSSVIDVLNPIRNKTSMAHPNEHLLDEPEAMLVINSARTIIHYLDAKLGRHKKYSLPF